MRVTHIDASGFISLISHKVIIVRERVPNIVSRRRVGLGGGTEFKKGSEVPY